MKSARLMRLKGLRIENDITQKEMARILGISISAYCNRELGVQPFTQWEIERIMKVFGRSYEDIFVRSERRVYANDT